LVAAAKFLVAETKFLFVVPNFVAVTKPVFPCGSRMGYNSRIKQKSTARASDWYGYLWSIVKINEKAM